MSTFQWCVFIFCVCMCSAIVEVAISNYFDVTDDRDP